MLLLGQWTHHRPCPMGEVVAPHGALCPGQSPARKHLSRAWVSILIVTEPGIFQLREPQPGAEPPETMAGRGVRGSWDDGDSVWAQATVLNSPSKGQRHQGPVPQLSCTHLSLPGLQVSQQPGQKYNCLCFHEPGGQERASHKGAHTPGFQSCLSRYWLCCVTWAELHSLPSSEHNKLSPSLRLWSPLLLMLSSCIFITVALFSPGRGTCGKVKTTGCHSANNERTSS